MSWRALVAPPGGISCRRVRKLVQSFLDDELTGRERDRLATHLDRCPACGVEAETYRRIKVALAPEAPAEAVARLTAHAHQLVDEGPSSA
ncbi:MAG: zf-HC2 domain-containing protein [Acidimicrobiales bacterium]|nr:zf-HC2 domain-containing protein [Acidimicrobiales bacterium]